MWFPLAHTPEGGAWGGDAYAEMGEEEDSVDERERVGEEEEEEEFARSGDRVWSVLVFSFVPLVCWEARLIYSVSIAVVM